MQKRVQALRNIPTFLFVQGNELGRSLWSAAFCVFIVFDSPCVEDEYTCKHTGDITIHTEVKLGQVVSHFVELFQLKVGSVQLGLVGCTDCLHSAL